MNSVRTVHYYVILIAKARNESSAYGSVVKYESGTVSAVRSLVLDGSPDNKVISGFKIEHRSFLPIAGGKYSFY